jgi:hypothetical protein
MRKLLFFLAAFSAAGLTGAQSASINGNQLLTLMNGSTMEQAVALGYVVGASNSSSNGILCIPQGVDAGQLRDVVKKNLEVTPAIRHMEAFFLVEASLVLIWPCPSLRK